MNRTVDRADIVLPAATFAEASGTLVSSEGRAQLFYQAFVPGDPIQAAWTWLAAVGGGAQEPDAGGRRSLDSVREEMTRELPLLAPLRGHAPSADLRSAGQAYPRQPHRSSGRTAVTANIDVREVRPPEDRDSPLVFSMEGSEEQPPSPLIARYWAPGWNSVQALNKFQQEVGGPLRGGDPGIRLLERSGGPAPAYFPAITAAPDDDPAAAEPPAYRLFGSEELSRCAPAIAARSHPCPGGTE
jgi:NADH-quinone oxidoreductase subunit G